MLASGDTVNGEDVLLAIRFGDECSVFAQRNDDALHSAFAQLTRADFRVLNGANRDPGDRFGFRFVGDEIVGNRCLTRERTLLLPVARRDDRTTV